MLLGQSYDSQGQSFKTQDIYAYLRYVPTVFQIPLQRYSNNSKPLFSDAEILAVHFFVGHKQKHSRIKEIHNFAKEYCLTGSRSRYPTRRSTTI